ncbi:MAG: hypothetical protein F6K07_32865 [Okeania sp. SIO1H5]|uniref:hypothetical protein n=1 Tax=Okeania sp. SIO1H5 TaxID=2607777 RepID=UPI0013BD7F16|nr:hypothetical protein [Okeania sp. SIO1H5]NET23788.1 hypothetical protein [Okeania sp. SIO1H5]
MSNHSINLPSKTEVTSIVRRVRMEPEAKVGGIGFKRDSDSRRCSEAGDEPLDGIGIGKLLRSESVKKETLTGFFKVIGSTAKALQVMLGEIETRIHAGS